MQINAPTRQDEDLLDATEEGRDGKDVFIKRIDCRTHSNELNIISRLGSSKNRGDKRNHCVPILAVFSDEQDPWYQYIVMPVLRPFYEPNFTTFGEVIDFVNQTLKASFFPLLHAFILTITFRVSFTSTSKTWHIGGLISVSSRC